MPQGGMDDGETPLEAAFRELHEETGATTATVLAELPEWLSYDLPDDLTQRPRWASRYRGQRQRWFADAVRWRRRGRSTSPPRIRSSMPGAGSPLASSCRSSSSPFKRPVYERIVEAFGPLAHELAQR